MAADPYQIQGMLPFGQGGNALAGAQGGLAGLAGQYQTGYNSALAQNQANYSNILSGYQGVMGGQRSAQDAISHGYSDLYNNVLGGIQGIGASQSQQIADTYAQQSGAMGQSLISRGLGNTTVADTMQRGLTLDQSKAQIALANQIAQLNAGYQSNLGLAGLNNAERSNMQNTQLAGHQLDWMNSITSKYPNSAEYNALFGMQGQSQQAAADRAALERARTTGGATVPSGGFGGAGFRNSGWGSQSFQPYAGWAAAAAPTNYGGGGMSWPGMYGEAPGSSGGAYSMMMPTEEPPLADPYNLGGGGWQGTQAYYPDEGGAAGNETYYPDVSADQGYDFWS